MSRGFDGRAIRQRYGDELDPTYRIDFVDAYGVSWPNRVTTISYSRVMSCRFVSRLVPEAGTVDQSCSRSEFGKMQFVCFGS